MSANIVNIRPEADYLPNTCAPELLQAARERARAQGLDIMLVRMTRERLVFVAVPHDQWRLVHSLKPFLGPVEGGAR